LPCLPFTLSPVRSPFLPHITPACFRSVTRLFRSCAEWRRDFRRARSLRDRHLPARSERGYDRIADDPTAHCGTGTRASLPGSGLPGVGGPGSICHPTALDSMSELSRSAALITVRARCVSRAGPVRTTTGARGDRRAVGRDWPPLRPKAVPTADYVLPYQLSSLCRPLLGTLGRKGGARVPAPLSPARGPHSNSKCREQGRSPGSRSAANCCLGKGALSPTGLLLRGAMRFGAARWEQPGR
jgi:hypothetical protein